MSTHQTTVAAATALLLLNFTVAGLAGDPPAPATHAVVEEWPIEGLPEPSGIVYNPASGTLFVCGDEGDVGEVDLDGKLLRVRNIGGDLEGIAVNPSTGMLYVIREGHEILFELRPDDFKVMRRFTIDRTFDGNANYLQRGGDGIEGLEFVPDEGHPEGGRFFAVNQFDPPVFLELEVPLRSSKESFESATIKRAREVSSAPLSGIHWVEGSHSFLVPSALWRAVYVLDANGKRLRTVRIPGLMQEGITSLPDGSFVIVQDTGGLIRWRPAGDPFAVEGNEIIVGGTQTKAEH